MNSRTTYTRIAKTAALEKIKGCSYELTDTHKYASWDNDRTPMISIKDRAVLYRALIVEIMKENECSSSYAWYLVHKMRKNKESRYYNALQMKKN